MSSKHLDFDLTEESWGEYMLEAESLLTAKYDLDGDGLCEIERWHAEAILERFWHKEPSLGVE